MEPENKFPYCTMELLNSERSEALREVDSLEDAPPSRIAQKAFDYAYYRGYADAMDKAVRVISYDFKRAGDAE